MEAANLGGRDLGDTVVITGAFSYTGKYATRLLLSRGHKVRTLTYHPERANPFGDQVQVFPYNFDNPEQLTQTLRGASTLINTYWVRFPRGQTTFETAVRNTRTLIRAAKDAGVKRIVHVSIANPSLESPLGYYKGKAHVEKAVIDSGLSYAILRPTVNSSASKTYSSTTSPGSSVVFLCSASPVTVATVSGLSTSRIWRGWSSTPQGRKQVLWSTLLDLKRSASRSL